MKCFTALRLSRSFLFLLHISGICCITAGTLLQGFSFYLRKCHCWVSFTFSSSSLLTETCITWRWLSSMGTGNNYQGLGLKGREDVEAQWYQYLSNTFVPEEIGELLCACLWPFSRFLKACVYSSFIVCRPLSLYKLSWFYIFLEWTRSEQHPGYWRILLSSPFPLSYLHETSNSLVLRVIFRAGNDIVELYSLLTLHI
jgi:hypothetical protein